MELIEEDVDIQGPFLNTLHHDLNDDNSTIDILNLVDLNNSNTDNDDSLIKERKERSEEGERELHWREEEQLEEEERGANPESHSPLDRYKSLLASSEMKALELQLETFEGPLSNGEMRKPWRGRRELSEQEISWEVDFKIRWLTRLQQQAEAAERKKTKKTSGKKTASESEIMIESNSHSPLLSRRSGSESLECLSEDLFKPHKRVQLARKLGLKGALLAEFETTDLPLSPTQMNVLYFQFQMLDPDVLAPISLLLRRPLFGCPGSSEVSKAAATIYVDLRQLEEYHPELFLLVVNYFDSHLALDKSSTVPRITKSAFCDKKAKLEKANKNTNNHTHHNNNHKNNQKNDQLE